MNPTPDIHPFAGDLVRVTTEGPDGFVAHTVVHRRVVEACLANTRATNAILKDLTIVLVPLALLELKR